MGHFEVVLGLLDVMEGLGYRISGIPGAGSTRLIGALVTDR
jgi:hypothetical protein